MVRNATLIYTDSHGKELMEKSPQLLNLTANSGDIHQFAASHIPSHWHQEIELFTLSEGHVQVTVRGCAYQLQAGDGCFINTEVIHSFTAKTPAPCTFRSFVFSPDIIGGTPGSIFDTAYVRPMLEQGAPFLKLQEKAGDNVYFEQFGKAFASCTEEPYGFEFQVRDALSAILLHVKSKSNIAPARAIPSIQETRLKEMLLWIDRNLGNSISISQIAGAANICPRECQRIFNRYLHYSPIAYVQRKRILAAAKELAETGSPVTEIALNYGFSNPSYFSKQFKALLGRTPSEYRDGFLKEQNGQANFSSPNPHS